MSDVGAELGEIRKHLSSIDRALGGIEATQLNQAASVASLAIGAEKRDERLRAVEQRQYWFLGLGSGVGACLGAILARIIPGHP